MPQINAEDRLFLNLSLEFLGEYRLPKMEFDGTAVGGLSGITYDRQRDRFYIISDDRSEYAPARFYTAKLVLGETSNGEESGFGIQTVEIERVTTLLGEDGNPFPTGTIDLEGIALSPQRSLYISSEGVTSQGIAPFIDEFDLETGQWQRRLPIPDRYRPVIVEDQPFGVQDNLGFEALTISANGYGVGQIEPFRLFAATESALRQDIAPNTIEALPSPNVDPQDPSNAGESAQAQPARFLHYLVGEDLPTLLAEHLYWVEAPPDSGAMNGLVDLLPLGQGGHLLSLERSFGWQVGFNAQIFQLVAGDATDISGVPQLSGDLTGITPIHKRLLLNLADLGMPLDNLEGMIAGPQLPDGTQSLVLVSDDNFNDLQTTQFLLFRLVTR